MNTPEFAEVNKVGDDAVELDTDLLIVGAGPVGLFGTYYAGFRGMHVTLLDSLPEVGGQISAMYPEKELLDIAGFPAVKGRDLVSNLVEQASQFAPRYVLGHQATTLERHPDADGGPDQLIITTSLGMRITTRALLITGGIGTFTPRPLPTGADYEGHGVEYFVPSPRDYADHDVVIVGGGDSAVDWAVTLQPLARSVTLVHRRKAFRAHATSVEKAHSLGVTVLTNAQVTKVLGGEKVEAVEITMSDENNPRRVECQRVVAALGFTANLGPLRDWDLDLARNRQIIVDSAMRTNVPGIFAAGDITEYEGKVRLIAVGFGEAATAVNHAAVHLNPGAALFPGHSTDAAPTPVESTQLLKETP